MATAAERTEIIQLVVGMIGAAPGADNLAELEAIFDSGVSLEELAIAISENPAFSGDTGIYPDFLPNAIFAENFVTDLIGDEVSDANLALAIEAVTGLLNSGESRGAVMYAAITAVAAVATDDADFGAASAAIANKTAVAEYFSVTVAQNGATIADLQAVLDGVDSTDDSVTDGTDAVDTEIAANAELSDLVANLDAANAAKTALLDALEDNAVVAALDPTAGDDITQADIVTLAAGAAAATEAATVAAGAGAGYAAGSDALKAALVSDARDAVAAQLVIDNTALAAALNTTAGTGSVAGLDGAIANLTAAMSAADDAIEAAALAGVEATAKLGDYNVLNASAVTLNGDGSTSGGEIIVSGTTLVLGAGITEATDPGITALLAASLANEGAQLASAAAVGAANDALDIVENLDQNAGRTTDLNTLTGLFTFITPATAGEATDAEIAAEIAALEAGNAQLEADLLAVTFDTDDATTLAAVEAIVDAAETAGFINAGDNAAIIAAFADDATDDDDFDPGVGGALPAALAAAAGAVAMNSLAFDVDAANTTYLGNGTALVGGETVAAALALAPLSLAANGAAAAVAVTTALGTDVDDALAAEGLLSGAESDLDDLDDDIADAQAAFAGAGFAVPVTLDSAVKAATVADDVFLTGGINSQIISFAGDDQLFIGDGLTLNADTTAGDEGDNAVLEVWITGTTNAVITIETSVFGSDAAVPETYSITLTGVSAADVVLSADGVISLA